MGQILEKFTVELMLPGTLSANVNMRWTVPSNCTLLHVSAVASNDSDATIDIGTSADTDGYLDGKLVGDSNTPAEYDLDDFNGALVTDQTNEYPQIVDGTIMVVICDFDGASGTAADDLTIVLTFSEG